MTQRSYDVVVIGGGAVGENAADYAVRYGLTAVLVEADLIGGECSYWACIPSKALIRTPLAVAAARRLNGVTAEFDRAAVLDRRDSFVGGFDDTGQAEWAEGAGIEVLRGHARISGERTVAVDTHEGPVTLRAEHAVVLATGSVAATPPIDGIDRVRTWTSRDATTATTVPARLGVLGGGVVGSELAQVFRRLGSEVTVIENGPRLLASMEDVAGQRVTEALRGEGVDVRLDTTLDAVAADGDAVVLTAGGDTVVVDELLVATGRRPAVHDVGLDAVGLDPAQPLKVDDSGLVGGGGGWLYAVGDVAGRAPLTHQGKYAARIAGAAIAARARDAAIDPGNWSEHTATADHAAVPQVVFTDPEVACVGRTAEQARRAGLDVRVVDLDIAVAGSALQADDYSGAVRMVVDAERELLVGVTFVGQDVAELLHAATIAIVGEVPMSRLWHAVPAFPTISEVWLRLLETYRAQQA